MIGADRCNRYRDRLDAHLATLPSDPDRRSFLDREAAKWIDRYETWKGEVDAGTYTGTANAFDFHITMLDVEIRRMRFSPRRVSA